MSTPLLSLDDLKHPDIAKRIQEKAKMALVGMIPDDYIDEIVEAATADLFAFKLKLKCDRYPVGHDNDEPYSSYQAERTAHVFSLKEYNDALVREPGGQWRIFETREEPMHLPVFDENHRHKRAEDGYSRLYEEHTTPILFAWRAESGEHSFFYKVITEAARSQGQKFLIEQVGTYFTRGPTDVTGYSGYNPTDVLQAQLKDAMPKLLESVFGNLLANGLGNFHMHLQHRMRNGGFG